jgi:hypothetical protein
MSQESKPFERFFARILLKYTSQGDREGRPICYIYNRESLDDFLKIKKQEWDNSQFIEIGDILELEGHNCIVKEINFKLEDHVNKMDHGYGINVYGLTDPTDFNCQICVLVERME